MTDFERWLGCFESQSSLSFGQSALSQDDVNADFPFYVVMPSLHQARLEEYMFADCIINSCFPLPFVDCTAVLEKIAELR